MKTFEEIMEERREFWSPRMKEYSKVVQGLSGIIQEALPGLKVRVAWYPCRRPLKEERGEIELGIEVISPARFSTDSILSFKRMIYIGESEWISEGLPGTAHPFAKSIIRGPEVFKLLCDANRKMCAKLIFLEKFGNL